MTLVVFVYCVVYSLNVWLLQFFKKKDVKVNRYAFFTFSFCIFASLFNALSSSLSYKKTRISLRIMYNDIP